MFVFHMFGTTGIFLPNLNQIVPYLPWVTVTQAAIELPYLLRLEEHHANEYEYDGAHQDVDLI